MLNTTKEETRLLKVSDLTNERGWSTDELAAKAGIAFSTAQSYIRDYPEYLSRKVLIKIANALEVQVSELFLKK